MSRITEERSPRPEAAREHVELVPGRVVPAIAGIPLWGDVRRAYLEEETKRELGSAEPRREDVWPAFTVTQTPNLDLIVTLNVYCDLSDVHDACAAIVNACFEGSEHVEFTRDPERANARMQRWGKSDG